MEDHIRHESRMAKSMTEDRRVRITEVLMANEDLLFLWCFCATDLFGDTSTILLKQVVELYLTVWEFFIVSKKNTNGYIKHPYQKKKSLRSELNTGQ